MNTVPSTARESNEITAQPVVRENESQRLRPGAVGVRVVPDLDVRGARKAVVHALDKSVEERDELVGYQRGSQLAPCVVAVAGHEPRAGGIQLAHQIKATAA